MPLSDSSNACERSRDSDLTAVILHQDIHSTAVNKLTDKISDLNQGTSTVLTHERLFKHSSPAVTMCEEKYICYAVNFLF